MMALVVAVFAQSCTALLPARDMDLEWFRDGRPLARDVVVESTRTARTYRREHRDGRRVERVLTCASGSDGSWLVDRVGSSTVRFPVALEIGATRTANGAAIRRIDAPADAQESRGTQWYSVSSPGIAVYALARGVGVLEVRTPAPSGGFTVLRAVARERRREPPPDTASPAHEALPGHERSRLLERIVRLETTELALRDSIRTLLRALDDARHVPSSSTNVVELDAVDVYVERREFHSAIELLESVMARLRAWSDSAGTRHLALDVLDRRLHEVLSQCAEAAAAARRSRPVQCRIAW